LNKNETKSALESGLRAFIKAYLIYNPAVLDADKESMGLPLHDTTRTPIPPPDSSSRYRIALVFIRNGFGFQGRRCTFVPAGKTTKVKRSVG
jgi:hypothetical protein